MLCWPNGLYHSLQVVLTGILRGCGHQHIGAIGNLVAFYLIGLPLGICLALVVHMGALGMWIGLLVASLVQVHAHVCVGPTVFQQ